VTDELSELVLYDFRFPRAADGWYEINDVVMGGISESRVIWLESGHLLFSGSVSLEKGGGFASIRSPETAADLSPARAIRLTARGDGKTYKFSIRTSRSLDGISYQVAFTATGPAPKEFAFRIDEFNATYHGQRLAGTPSLDPARITNLGFIIADRQDGPFRLEIRKISALLQAPAPLSGHVEDVR
jgi:NADH dehydrogenase [ubiquinone] 1 alpha subcomplex assembly factor 1